jgi:hypothetical protein
MWLCALQSQQYLCREVKQERPWNAVHDAMLLYNNIVYDHLYERLFTRFDLPRRARTVGSV